MGGKIEKYIGQTFNHLTITGIDRERMDKEKEIKGHYINSYVFADCDCGKCGGSYNINKIKRGETQSCGHLKISHGKQYKYNVVEFKDDYGIIYTLDGTAFYFDKEDYPLIQDKFWYNSNGYLYHCYVLDGKNHYVAFHRLIMNVDDNLYVDHKDRNTTNNRKSNLRICTHQENDRNSNLTSANKSGVLGVYFDKSRKKWTAVVTINHKEKYFGRYVNFDDAVRARLKGEIEYFKEFAPQTHLINQYFSEEESKELWTKLITYEKET